MDEAPPGPKTNRGHLANIMWGRYCRKVGRFEVAKGKKGGATMSQTQSQILSNSQHTQQSLPIKHVLCDYCVTLVCMFTAAGP